MLAQVEPRLTAVIADTVAWEDFPRLWRPMLDEVYAFVRACPEFAAPIEGTPGPHWTNVMLYRDAATNVEVGVIAPSDFTPAIGETHDAVRGYAHDHGLATASVLWEVYGHPDDGGAFATEVFHLLA